MPLNNCSKISNNAVTSTQFLIFNFCSEFDYSTNVTTERIQFITNQKIKYIYWYFKPCFFSILMTRYHKSQGSVQGSVQGQIKGSSTNYQQAENLLRDFSEHQLNVIYHPIIFLNP